MSELSINKRLNLVVPVETEAGDTLYVHAQPLMWETFKAYYAPLSRTYTRIFAGGGGDMAGPRVAAFVLEEVSRELGVWDGPKGVRHGLMEEIQRLTNVVTLGPSGWTTQPYTNALAQKLISVDDIREVEHVLVFFTVISAMSERGQQKGHLEVLKMWWSVQPESSDSTVFAASLSTSKKVENTGEKVTA